MFPNCNQDLLMQVRMEAHERELAQDKLTRAASARSRPRWAVIVGLLSALQARFRTFPHSSVRPLPQPRGHSNTSA
jgi:hypothetical protein